MRDRDGEPATWNVVGPLLLADALEDAERELDDTVATIATAVRDDGTVRREDVRELRQVIDALQGVVEERMAPLVGATPYGTTTQNVSYDAMCEALGISIEELNDARTGRDE